MFSLSKHLANLQQYDSKQLLLCPDADVRMMEEKQIMDMLIGSQRYRETHIHKSYKYRKRLANWSSNQIFIMTDCFPLFVVFTTAQGHIKKQMVNRTKERTQRTLPKRVPFCHLRSTVHKSCTVVKIIKKAPLKIHSENYSFGVMAHNNFKMVLEQNIDNQTHHKNKLQITRKYLHKDKMQIDKMQILVNTLNE